MKNYFFDMDGVLTVYERSIFEECDPDVPWYRALRGQHYFTTCIPQQSFVDLVRHLLLQGEDNVWVITSIGTRAEDEEDFKEHCADKRAWCKKYIPELTDEQLLFCRAGKQPKAMIAKQVLQKTKLDEKDILFDDFNPNLNVWRENGGCAIKVKNNENSYRKDMPHIESEQSLLQLVAYLQTY